MAGNGNPEASADTASPHPQPTKADIRRWRKYLADERGEAAVYRDLAGRRTGEEREILLGLAEAEARHEAHWVNLLGRHADDVPAVSLRTRVLGFLARRFGSVFVLALAQRAEARSPYATDSDATLSMAADERIHGEVVRGLAERGRMRLSGTFRAAIFGANDGLVSNLSLVMGVAGAGVANHIVLLTGVAGLLAGALSMGAGEYVSVRSQRELLDSSVPDPEAARVIPDLDVDANELALVYRARGMSEQDAQERARRVIAGLAPTGAEEIRRNRASEAVGSGLGAAVSSFLFFASGALIPILPYLFGLQEYAAMTVSVVLVGITLLATGAVVGVLSGASPLKRALRLLVIGYGAAAVTYLLGLLFGTTVL